MTEYSGCCRHADTFLAWLFYIFSASSFFFFSLFLSPFLSPRYFSTSFFNSISLLFYHFTSFLLPLIQPLSLFILPTNKHKLFLCTSCPLFLSLPPLLSPSFFSLLHKAVFDSHGLPGLKPLHQSWLFYTSYFLLLFFVVFVVVVFSSGVVLCS